MIHWFHFCVYIPDRIERRGSKRYLHAHVLKIMERADQLERAWCVLALIHQ